MRRAAVVVLLVIVAVVTLCLCACNRNEPAPLPLMPTIIVNVQNIQGVSPTPQPTPVGLSGVIVGVRMGFFGGTCPDGGEVRNGVPLRVDCVGFATATPVGAGDVKLPLEVHGPDCTWATDRSDVVRIDVTGGNPFNADIHALRPGVAHVSATVKGVTGTFTVEVVR